MSSLLPLFRKIGIAEGISLLLLLGIAMPLKYFAEIPEAVKFTGWVHGILFITYCWLAYMVREEKGWPFKMLAWAFLAAFLPFGTFLFDKKISVDKPF